MKLHVNLIALIILFSGGAYADQAADIQMTKHEVDVQCPNWRDKVHYAIGVVGVGGVTAVVAFFDTITLPFFYFDPNTRQYSRPWSANYWETREAAKETKQQFEYMLRSPISPECSEAMTDLKILMSGGKLSPPEKPDHCEGC